MHRAWAEELKRSMAGDARAYVRQAVGEKFLKGLEDCGVYKQDEAGYAGVHRFVESVNQRGGVEDEASVRAFEQ